MGSDRSDSTVTLIERLERREPNPTIRPIVERRVPEWVRRAQQNRLPNSDKTGQVAA
jgi:hypothetical protein